MGDKSFLSEFDAIPESNAQVRIGLFFKWLRSDWKGLFKELRASRPILATPAFVFVTHWADVTDALSRHETFTVGQNVRSMDPSVGPFMLARDGQRENWHDKSVMRSLLRWEDLASVRALAGDEAEAALDGAQNTVELVSAIGRRIPRKVVQDYFGFAGCPDADVLRWSRATQHDMFRNFPVNDAVHEANLQAGAEMRSWVRTRLQDRSASPCAPTSIFDRLLELVGHDQSVMSVEQVVSNVCGLLVGAIETTSQAIVQAVEQILLDEQIAALAKEAAQRDDPDEFDAIVWEALRFNPITTFVIRIASRDAVLAPGAAHQVSVPAGTPVAPCIGSAMFDDHVLDEPDQFKPGRPPQHYMHLGFAHHECLGKHVGLQIIPEAVRKVLLTPGIRLLDGDRGKIDFTDPATGQPGPFPERFEVGVGTA